MTTANVRSFRDILVYLSAGDNAAARVGAAIALAQLHGARLAGVEVNHPSVYETDRAPEATDSGEHFLMLARAAGIEHVFHVASRDDAAGWRGLYAHYTDLVIAPSASEADAGLVLRGVPEDVLVNAGVPVVVIPDLWKPVPLGRRVMVSWNASREATRAVHDAMPFLTRAESVTIFAFDARHDVLREECDLLQNHLAQHGVAVSLFPWPGTGDIDPVSAMFSCLSESDADLIVAGGYGHSRLMERMLGGVSRTLARTLTVPVLMSH